MKSPLKDNKNDSIAASNAWKQFKKGYMDRKEHPARPGKPISAEENKAEYDREKMSFITILIKRN